MLVSKLKLVVMRKHPGFFAKDVYKRQGASRPVDKVLRARQPISTFNRICGTIRHFVYKVNRSHTSTSVCARGSK